MTCDEALIRFGGSWADSRKPNTCPNTARFERVVNGTVVERLCGVHRRVALRWKRPGEIRPITEMPNASK